MSATETIDDGKLKMWLEEEQSTYIESSKHKVQGHLYTIIIAIKYSILKAD